MKTAPACTPAPTRITPSPAWATPRGRHIADMDAGFYAGIAMKTLDDLVRAQPLWLGCWRARQALKCTSAAMPLIGRNEDENALRDAVLLTSAGDDAGPAGKLLSIWQRLATRKPVLSTKEIAELVAGFGLVWNENRAAIVDHADAAVQSTASAPVCASAFISATLAENPDAEPLAWMLADVVIAAKLGWPQPVALLMAERDGASFRIAGGKGRLGHADAAFAGAVCLAFVEGTNAALRSAGAIARRADTLLAVAPKLRTKGGGAVVQKLLSADALLATAAGTNLSRWAATRMFDRLDGFGAVRELSGRTSFRIFGL